MKKSKMWPRLKKKELKNKWKTNEKALKTIWKKKMQLEKGNRSPYRKGGIKVQKEYAKTKCDVKNSNS